MAIVVSKILPCRARDGSKPVTLQMVASTVGRERHMVIVVQNIRPKMKQQSKNLPRNLSLRSPMTISEAALTRKRGCLLMWNI